MKIHCRFIFDYPNQNTAEKIRDALEVDNYKFIQTEIKNHQLIANIESKSVMSLLHTIEDYLSCLTTAENVIAETEQQLENE